MFILGMQNLYLGVLKPVFGHGCAASVLVTRMFHKGVASKNLNLKSECCFTPATKAQKRSRVEVISIKGREEGAFLGSVKLCKTSRDCAKGCWAAVAYLHVGVGSPWVLLGTFLCGVVLVTTFNRIEDF